MNNVAPVAESGRSATTASSFPVKPSLIGLELKPLGSWRHIWRLFAAPVLLGAVLSASDAGPAQAADVSGVIGSYANIAEASYADSHAAALALQQSIALFLAKPTEDGLAAARQAWIKAREPYMQTEVFRFGNKIVDDWEGKVNAWPLDEGLIDYVSSAYSEGDTQENEAYAINVIANTSLKIGGQAIDASVISPELLSRDLHEAGGVEANVAIGYHAIEFLLWGQDLNGTGKGAGTRPATDFDLKACTNGNCDRRATYLRVVTQMLVDQLKWMAGNWAGPGVARRDVMKNGGQDGLIALFTGLGSLTYGELAGERMKLGLMIHDPEEEHDCFSDNTHNSHYYDVVGIRNIYLGSYTRIDGTKVSGPSVSDLVKAKNPEVDAKVRAALEATMARMGELKTRAETIEAYDQMLGEDNAEGNAVIQSAVDELSVLAKAFEEAIATLGLEGIAFEGSDSLDAPEKVLQDEAKKG